MRFGLFRKLPRERERLQEDVKKGKARILTDTPEINEIQKDKEKAMQRKRKLELKKTKKVVKRKLNMEETSSEEDNENEWEVDDDSDNDSSLADLEIDPTSFSLENIQQGDFILVQLKGKKHSGNFVATVISRVDNNDLIIKYLKKSFLCTWIHICY
ncbi:hypothetical protein NQ314_012626 [Rhamnusium bicolor]|uniref:Uncharacterized protein n=1 Tax=Rhamnusium bicolor TaxID=1586634 RepID=A0AAV8XA14_9CUCU|nr:hypothetical protein NQ314_012626 [Rhamnusium bicolor]